MRSYHRQMIIKQKLNTIKLVLVVPGTGRTRISPRRMLVFSTLMSLALSRPIKSTLLNGMKRIKSGINISARTTAGLLSYSSSPISLLKSSSRQENDLPTFLFFCPFSLLLLLLFYSFSRFFRTRRLEFSIGA